MKTRKKSAACTEEQPIHFLAQLGFRPVGMPLFQRLGFQMAGRKIEGGGQFQFSGGRHRLENFDLLRVHAERMARADGPNKAKEAWLDPPQPTWNFPPLYGFE
ncbi:MAG: hypothetical protein AB7V22_01440 [Kiritimatiellia bacterium]